jgi:hypothetical protein
MYSGAPVPVFTDWSVNEAEDLTEPVQSRTDHHMGCKGTANSAVAPAARRRVRGRG